MARSVVAYTSRRKLDETRYFIDTDKKRPKRTCCNCGEKFDVQEVKFMIDKKIFCSWNFKCEFKRKNKVE